MPSDDKTMLSALELLQVHNVVTFEPEERKDMFLYSYEQI